MNKAHDTHRVDVEAKFFATLQLVPCCYRFKMPRFQEQNVNIYIFKSLYRHQSFQQKSPDGHSCSAASIAVMGPF